MHKTFALNCCPKPNLGHKVKMIIQRRYLIFNVKFGASVAGSFKIKFLSFQKFTPVFAFVFGFKLFDLRLRLILFCRCGFADIIVVIECGFVCCHTEHLLSKSGNYWLLKKFNLQ